MGNDCSNNKYLSGNKGEWSEIYALFKLLGDGVVYAGDADMNKLSLYYPILDIIRKESKKYEYVPNSDQQVVVVHEDGVELCRVSMNTFIEKSKELLASIKNAGDRAFQIPETELFMNTIGCSKLKAPSSDKADIHIIIHDIRTNMTPLLGFSIKSQLGSPSTLLNAGKTTNIVYRVVGKTITDEMITSINSVENHLPRMQAVLDNGLKLEFEDMDCETFRNNLMFIDCCLPSFISNCLIADSLPNSTSSIKEIVHKIAQENPLDFKGKNVISFYEHKMKTLLLSSALGMMPAKEWTGRYDANGGYLVVRTDGEIVCYHFYNQNDVEDYLFNNTRFERASRSRYDYGYLYRGEDGQVRIKLNLQIRFNK